MTTASSSIGGHVGTGFTQLTRDSILAQLETRRVAKPAFAAVPRDIARQARWVRPELVAEVTYAEITPDGSLRHPSFQGMREDKTADQVVLELPNALPASAETHTLDAAIGKEVAGAVGVRLTHPDKVMFPGRRSPKPRSCVLRRGCRKEAALYPGSASVLGARHRRRSAGDLLSKAQAAGHAEGDP